MKYKALKSIIAVNNRHEGAKVRLFYGKWGLDFILKG